MKNDGNISFNSVFAMLYPFRLRQLLLAAKHYVQFGMHTYIEKCCKSIISRAPIGQQKQILLTNTTAQKRTPK